MRKDPASICRQTGTAFPAFGATCFESTFSSAPIICVVTLLSSTKTCGRHGRWAGCRCPTSIAACLEEPSRNVPGGRGGVTRKGDQYVAIQISGTAPPRAAPSSCHSGFHNLPYSLISKRSSACTRMVSGGSLTSRLSSGRRSRPDSFVPFQQCGVPIRQWVRRWFARSDRSRPRTLCPDIQLP
jgi:hypothetical protein